MDYEKDMEIDESALDVEWLQQPRLMHKYAAKVADTKRNMDLAKERLDIIKAELDKEIRTDPDKFDIAKITEAVVGNTIVLSPEYQEASNEFIEAKYNFEMSVAAVRSIDQKKTALESLVKLHGQQYFAGPSVPRDLSKEVQNKELQKQSNTKVARNIKRRG